MSYRCFLKILSYAVGVGACLTLIYILLLNLFYGAVYVSENNVFIVFLELALLIFGTAMFIVLAEAEAHEQN